MAAFLVNPAAEGVLRLRFHATARVDEDTRVFTVCHLTDKDVVVARRDGVMRREALIFVEKLAMIRQISAYSHVRSMRQSHREILDGGVERVEAYQLV